MHDLPARFLLPERPVLGTPWQEQGAYEIRETEDSVITALEYFLEHGHKEIGLLVGQEETADATPLQMDPRQRTFQQFLTEKGL